MPLTFGLTGMDPATETSLKAAFDQANQRLGGVWQLLPDTQGDYIVVDMVAEAATGQRTPEEAAKRAEQRANRYYRV